MSVNNVASKEGYALIELMIAVAVMSLVLLALGSVFYVYQKQFQEQLIMHQHQEAARKTYALIRDSVHVAGQVGCRKVASDFSVQPFNQYSLTLQNHLEIKGGHLSVIYQRFPVATVMKPMRKPGLIHVDTGVWFKSGQYLLISDCRHAEIFRAAHVSPEHGYQIVRTEQPLHYWYSAMAEVGRLYSREIYIDEGLIIKNRLLQRRFRYVSGVSGLVFSQDEGGLAFEFVTRFGGSSRRWYGYAAQG